MDSKGWIPKRDTTIEVCGMTQAAEKNITRYTPNAEFTSTTELLSRSLVDLQNLWFLTQTLVFGLQVCVKLQ